MHGVVIKKPDCSLFLLNLTLSLLLLLSGCDSNKEKQPSQPTIQSVTVTAVRNINVAETVERVAQTQATEDIELMARVEGFLIERKFIEGSNVNKGDLLFVIEKAAYEAEVQRITAELEKSKAEHIKEKLNLVRVRSLRKEQASSQAELENAIATEKMIAAEIAVHQAELSRAKLDLGYTEVKAPIDGRIGRSEFSVGDLVNRQSEPLTTIVALDPIYVYWEVSEHIPLDYRKRFPIKNGKFSIKVTTGIRFSDGSTYGHEGRIDFIDNRVDRSTGTQRVRAVFPNPDNILVPGQYVTIVIQIGESRERLAVPQSAVQADRSGYYVLVVNENNVVSIKRTEMGDRKGVFWVVEEGLTEGESVIYQGIQKVRPGSTVKPVRKDLALPHLN